MNQLLRWLMIAPPVIVLLMVAGCGGPSTGTVKGKVSFAGQAVKGWIVQLESAKTGTGASAALDGDGNFAFAEPLAEGKYVACFVMPLPEPPAPGVPKTALPAGTKLPAKYLSKSSGLAVDVKPGVNEISLELAP